MSKLFLKEIHIDLATQFWRGSPDATAFTNPAILESVATDLIWLGGYKGEELVVVTPLTVDQKLGIVQLPHFMYVGPMWSEKWHKLPIYRQYNTRLNILEYLINYCVENFGSFEFSLPPGMQDLRAYQWWNFHSNDPTKMIDLNVNYTAILDLNELRDVSNTSDFFRPDDKRKVIKKYERNEKLFAITHGDKSHINKFIGLYEETLARTKGDTSDYILETLERLTKVSLQNAGYMLLLKSGEEILGAQLLLGHRNFLNAVAQGSCSKAQKNGVTTILNYESIKFAEARNFKYYDFNGANSPRRADDKHSFGAIPSIYYSVRYQGS